MVRKAVLLALAATLVASPLLAKKARVRVQDKSAKPAPLRTIVVEPSDGPDPAREALREALSEARRSGSVRVRVVTLAPEQGLGPAVSLAPLAGGTGYRPADVPLSDPSYDSFPSNFHAEPSIAAQGDSVVCVYNDTGDDPTSPNPGVIGSTDGFSISSDRGASWRDMGKRAPAGNFTSFDGDNVVAAGPDSDFYYFSDGGKDGSSWTAMSASRSTDFGRTWSVPTSPSQGVVFRSDGFIDKGWIAVDRSSTPTRGNVYTTWSDFGTTATDLWVARSTDHGATWSAQKLDTFNHPVAVTYVQVAPNGLVYVGEQDEGTIVNGVFSGTNYVRVSADGGRTFGPLRSAGPYHSVGDPVADALCGNPGFFGGLVRYLNGPIESDSSLRIAVDPSDASGQTVFVTTQGIPDTPGDASDVFLWRSTDGGLTWADPIRVNDDTTKTDQFMPDLWVAPDGTLGVLWLDRRNDPKANWRLEAWMAISNDHGRTFGCSFPVSSRAFPLVGTCQMSDYNGVFADERGFLLAWGDSRQVDPKKQMTFSIYGAAVPLDGPGPILSLQDARIDPASGTSSRILVTLRNDGTADATELSVSVAIDGNLVEAPIANVRFPDVPACHGTASAVIAVPYAVNAPFLRGTVAVSGPRGTASLPFSMPRAGAQPAGTLLSADFESGAGDFTADPGSLWHVTKQCAALATGHGGSGVAYFGNDASCGYSSGFRVSGALTSKTLALPPGGTTLRFREWVGLARRWSSDRALVQISTDGGSSFENLWGYGSMSRYVLDPAIPLTDASGNPSWHDVALDLSDYAGHDVVLRFFAYVGVRSGRGWAIDDVRLASVSSIPNGAPGTCAAPQDLAAAGPSLTLGIDASASAAAPGDPAPPCGDGTLRHPFWMTYTPPVDGTYAFSACSLTGSGLLSVWSGSCGGVAPLACAAVQPCNLPSVPVPLKVEGKAGVPLRILLSGASDADVSATVSVNALAEGSLVPIVLDVPSGTAHYRTQLALTNHGVSASSVTLTYTPVIGTGSGSVPATVAAGSVLQIEDILDFLRAGGVAIPTSAAGGAQAGTLRVVANGVPAGSLSAIARTVTPAGNGTASLSYGAVPLSGGGRSTVFGLRTTPQDRSKVAVYNPSFDPVTYRVTMVSGAGDGRKVVYRDGATLPPGGWFQYNDILADTDIANGWAVVERTSAAGVAAAYGVVNDNGTNDGSFLPPVSSEAAASTLTVPVLVETPRYASELVLANQGSADAALTLRYRESLDGAGGGATVTVTLPAGTQRILSDAFGFLRQNGATFGPKGRSYAGALRIGVAGAAPGDVWAAVRASAPLAGGGAFGLFVPAISRGAEAADAATVDALRADATNRSNVAVVNAGSDSDGPVTLRLQVFDGASGNAAGSAVPVTLPPGGWAQPADLFAASGVAKGWVSVTRTAGTAPWIAYGIVNDGAKPGQRTDDGAYVEMRK